MKSRQWIALAFGICLLFVASPCAVLAQTTNTGTGTGATGTGGTGGTSTGTGATGTGTTGSSNPAPGTAETPGFKPIPVKSVTSGTGTATTIPSNSNPFVSTYGDYLSLGMPNKYATTYGPVKTTATFGKGIYTTTPTTTTTTPTTAYQANGFVTTGIVRNPQYTTVLSDELPPVVHHAEKVWADVRAVIDRSSYVKNKNAIQINVSGNTIELRGVVGSEKERRMVEGMARMTPGVRDVQNDLKIVQSK